MMLDEKYITNLLEYIQSGHLAEAFEYSAEERRYEILDFLEQLMELGEAADTAATSIIFQKTQLKELASDSSQSPDAHG